MNSLGKYATLKEVNAFKKKITWGDVPAIYHLVSSSLGDIDGLLTHGFDSAYKRILSPDLWNLDLLQVTTDQQGNLNVKHKPKIILRHEYNDMGYELHCYPVLHGKTQASNPFNNWIPESMQMLFRINSLVAFSVFCFQSGDDADAALIKFAYHKVENLISTLAESFQIIEVKGYNIAQFYQEIVKRNGDIITHIKT